MKTTLTILFAWTLSFTAQAQDDGVTDLIATYLAAKLHQDSIDQTDIVVEYQYRCKTFDADNHPVTDSMRLVLQVGSHCTRFYPYHKYKEDTEDVNYFTPENYTMVQSDAFCHVPEVWINYPEGKMTVRDIIPPTHYETNEDLERPTWTVLEQDTLTINGYRCKTARCESLGQGWTVRYTEENHFIMEGLENVKTPVFYEHNAITKKVSEKTLIKNRNKIFGNKLYPKNPMYYTDIRALSSTEDFIYYESGNGEISWIINGAFVGSKAHVFQPLEK